MTSQILHYLYCYCSRTRHQNIRIHNHVEQRFFYLRIGCQVFQDTIQSYQLEIAGCGCIIASNKLAILQRNMVLPQILKLENASFNVMGIQVAFVFWSRQARRRTLVIAYNSINFGPLSARTWSDLPVGRRPFSRLWTLDRHSYFANLAKNSLF